MPDDPATNVPSGRRVRQIFRARQPLRCSGARHVEKHDVHFAAHQSVDGIVACCRLQCGKVDQADAQIRLLREMLCEIGIMHWRHRAPAHHGMPVYPIVLVLIGREEVPEGGVALQLRSADDQRDTLLRKYLAADLDRPANAADRWAGIESRADLVVADRWRRAPSTRKIRGRRLASIQAGVSLRLVPARPMARQSAKRDSAASGTRVSSTVGTPPSDSASITSVEPVRSSP